MQLTQSVSLDIVLFIGSRFNGWTGEAGIEDSTESPLLNERLTPGRRNLLTMGDEMPKHAINEFQKHRTQEDTYRRQRNRLLALLVLMCVGKAIAAAL